MLRAIAPYLAFGFMSLVGWTSRLRVRGGEHRLSLRERGQHFIYALWHNRQVFFTYSHRGERASVMVSRSRDGEMIVKVMELSRIRASRGSSSRDSRAAIRDMMQLVREGWDLGITPDGPKGPVYEAKSGTPFLARKLGIPILPITNAMSNRLTLKSWDKFIVPLPFSRAVVRSGAPIEVGPDDDLEAKAAELKASLDRITEEAEREVTPEGWRAAA